jgi:GT2 family glycosyltransferase
MSLKYGAVIVTFNRKAKLLKAVDTILNQTPAPEMLLIVDNASTDGTVEALEVAGVPSKENVNLIRLTENSGGSGGFYVALKEIQNYDVDWVSISDDDANFAPGYFAAMSEAISKHPEAGGFTSKVVIPDGRTDVTHRFHMIDKRLLRWREIPAEEYTSDFRVDGFTFVGSFISMDTIKHVGLPEKDFFIWWDDLDYAIRATKFKPFYNAPGAVIYHDTPSNAMDLKNLYHPDWRNYYGTRNMYYAFWKNAHPVLKYPYFLYKVGRVYQNVLSKRLKYGRRYEFFSANQALKDFILHRKGVNKHFEPGSSKDKEVAYRQKLEQINKKSSY